jgi:hypothetical protein
MDLQAGSNYHYRQDMPPKSIRVLNTKKGDSRENMAKAKHVNPTQLPPGLRNGKVGRPCRKRDAKKVQFEVKMRIKTIVKLAMTKVKKVIFGIADVTQQERWNWA